MEETISTLLNNAAPLQTVLRLAQLKIATNPYSSNLVYGLLQNRRVRLIKPAGFIAQSGIRVYYELITAENSAVAA